MNSVSDFAKLLLLTGKTDRNYKTLCGNIRSSIRQGKSLYGYRYSFEGEELKFSTGKSKKYSKTRIENASTGESFILNSRAEASKFLNVSRTCISNAINGCYTVRSFYRVYAI